MTSATLIRGALDSHPTCFAAVSHSPDPNRLAHNLHAPNLFDTSDGVVLYCDCCGRIQITFRGLSLLISVREFDVLCRTIAKAWEDLDDEDLGDKSSARTWRLSADTDAGNISVTLRLDELRALRHLLNGAYAMMTLREGLNAVAEGAGRNVALGVSDQ